MEETIDKILWVDRYNPNSIDDLVLDQSQKDYFNNIVKSKNISNMTLVSSNPGQGKTTLAELLPKLLNAIVLFVPCGTKGNIDTVRTTIKEFVESKSIDNELKVVIMDEFDSASGAKTKGGNDDGKATNDTMKAMRSLIEEHQDDTRFILTCNHLNKIIDPILSRCPPIKLKFSHKELLIRLIYILKQEKVKYTKESITQFLEIIVKKNFPDIRKIISILQNCCSTGTLIVDLNEESVTELEIFAKDIIEQIKIKKPLEVRQYIIQNKHLFNEEYNKLAEIILNLTINIITIEKTKKLIDYIYRIDNVNDPEVQFFGLILELFN
jgi:DNA polymerase III delta prime subunit